MTGNLHFEPVMLFFLVWALYKLHQQRWVCTAILIACSVSVKLIPLLFLPLFFQWFIYKDNKGMEKKSYEHQKKLLLSKYLVLKLAKLSLFYIIILTITTLLFLPFYTPELIGNYSSAVSLWFKDFEFNASFYYLFREIG